MSKKLEDFPVSEELVNQLIECNQNKWNGKKNTGKTILVNLSMVRMQIAWVLPKLLYAKGLADQKDADVLVLTWRANPLLSKLIESFGMEHLAIDDYIKKNPGSLGKAFFDTIGFQLSDGTGVGLKEYQKFGVSAGKSLYEDIIRTSDLSTLKSTRNKTATKKMVHILAFAYAMNKLIEKRNVIEAVMDDVPYHEGLLIKCLLKKDIPVVIVDNWRERPVPASKDANIELTGEYFGSRIRLNWNLLEENSSDWSLQYLEDRFAGKNGRNIDRGAFKDKKVVTRESVTEALGLDQSKKNVVIMAHTFTDGVFNYGDIYFRDYYDWLDKTLSLAEETTDVNWILKPHPTRGAYNESKDSIELMFERHKKEHMVLLSDDISAESIKNIADVIVTIGGNAGAEFACFGVPVVIAGKPYYSGFGYTIEPENYEAYAKAIHEIGSVKPLSEDEVHTARKVFNLRNNSKYDYLFGYFHDEFSDELNKKYDKMLNEIALQYFASNAGTQEYNDAIFSYVIQYFKEHDMTKCAYYQAGQNRHE